MTRKIHFQALNTKDFYTFLSSSAPNYPIQCIVSLTRIIDVLFEFVAFSSLFRYFFRLLENTRMSNGVTLRCLSRLQRFLLTIFKQL